MDVHEQLARIRSAVESARAMPMSASAVINRAELLSQIDALAAELPRAFAEAHRVTSDREGVVAEGRVEAERIIAEGHAERSRLMSEAEVYRVGMAEVQRYREEATQEIEGLRRETDEYVDSRLANFEIALNKTLDAVARGRERLKGRNEFDALGPDEGDEIGLPREFERPDHRGFG